MCILLHSNQVCIRWKYNLFSYMFCPNTDTRFREPYHLNHVIPRLDICRFTLATLLAHCRVTAKVLSSHLTWNFCIADIMCHFSENDRNRKTGNQALALTEFSIVVAR